MKITPTALPEVMILEPKVFGDERGFFMETWRDSWLNELGLDTQFVQDNHSLSSHGILRGLHYQIKKPQGKLVRVVRGKVFDVAVDVRKYSTTFGHSVGMELSAENKKMLWIPPGFAHGFLVLSDEAEFVYKCTEYYAPDYDRTLLWNDPVLNIDWPIPEDMSVCLSQKDQAGMPLSEADIFEEPVT